MKSRVGRYFRAKREARGLTAESVATMLGYRNKRKVVHRLLRLELEGIGCDNLLFSYAAAICLDYKTIFKLVTQDADIEPIGLLARQSGVVLKLLRGKGRHLADCPTQETHASRAVSHQLQVAGAEPAQTAGSAPTTRHWRPSRRQHHYRSIQCPRNCRWKSTTRPLPR